MFRVSLFMLLCAVADSGIALVERLFSSNLLVTVSSSLPNVLRIHHFRKGTEICQHTYEQAILAVRLNPQVCTACHVFDLSNYRTTLCYPGMLCSPVSISVSHKSEFCRNG